MEKKKRAFNSKRNPQCSLWIFEWLKVPLYFQKHYQHTGEKIKCNQVLFLWVHNSSCALHVCVRECVCMQMQVFDGWVFLYVHRNRRLIRDRSPGWPPGLSHSSWGLHMFKHYLVYMCADLQALCYGVLFGKKMFQNMIK